MKTLLIAFTFMTCVKVTAQSIPISETIRNELLSYLIENEVILKNLPIEEVKDYFFIVELNSIDSLVNNIGICKFGVTASHTNKYMLLLSVDKYKILSFINIETDMIELCEFLDSNRHSFDKKQRISYLRKTINMIETNYRE